MSPGHRGPALFGLFSAFRTLLGRRSESAATVLPSGLRIYAIGDVHGFAGHLDKLLHAIERDLAASPAARAEIVFLGDYIDRGPESAAVIDRLARRDVPLPFTALRGNHEALMLDALADPGDMVDWCRSGGDVTLASYGITLGPAAGKEAYARARMALINGLPEHHRAFLTGTLPYRVVGPCTFVHAGLRPGIPLERQTADDLFWIRDAFFRAADTFDGVVVHGHTPRREPENLPHRINVDTGVFKYGMLSCAVLEGPDRRFLSTRG